MGIVGNVITAIFHNHYYYHNYFYVLFLEDFNRTDRVPVNAGTNSGHL